MLIMCKNLELIKCEKPCVVGGWMDGWMDGWVDGWESRVKDCLQQSKIENFPLK